MILSESLWRGFMFETILPSGTIQTYFDSISEWYLKIDWSHSPIGQKSFHGDYQHVREAYEASLHSTKYVEQVKKVTSSLLAQIQASMPDYVPGMDVTGLGYDVGLALSGVPECWLTVQPSKDPKIVRILINTMVSRSLSDKQIISRGVGISALIMCLEVSGIGTEVIAAGEGFSPGTEARKGVHYFVTLKKADDYFDLEKFSFAICDPSFPRMLGFGWICTRCNGRDKGTTIKWPENAAQSGGLHGGEQLNGKDYDLAIDRAHSIHVDFQSLEATKEWVIAKCREFGVEISNPPLA